MALRKLGGESSVDEMLVVSMYSANGLAWAVGDICIQDTGANRTVKKPTDNAALWGRVVAIAGPSTATSATSTILSVHVFGYNSVIELQNDAAVALGVSPQSNGTANKIETSGAAAGKTLVISSDLNSDGSTYTITCLA